MTVPRLSLTEFNTTRRVPLSASERDAIRQLHPGITIEPSLGAEGLYDLTPDQHIGVVCVPTRTIEIRPKLDMSSVLFLVSYACGQISWFEGQPEFAADVELIELLALLLARLVEQATRRGLLNGYQSEDQTLQAPRGRLLFDEQIRRRLGTFPPVEVRHDVFTADVLENRLLLSALTAMSRIPFPSAVTRRELFRAQRLFGDVRLQHFPAASVPDVVMTRLNQHYHTAIALATLLLRAASLELGAGAQSGSAFLIDMNKAFEQFVRTALREALGGDGSAFPDRPPRTHLDTKAAIPLRPDLCFVKNRRIVWAGDAKYKRLPDRAYQNSDVYQLLAYTVALELDGGTLIYAADEGVREAEHVVVHLGKRLEVITLDLTAPKRIILNRIRQIADRIRKPAAA